MNSRTTQAIVAFRRLQNNDAICYVYDQLADMQPYSDDKEYVNDVQTTASAIMELMDALVEEGLLEPPGEDDDQNSCDVCGVQVPDEEQLETDFRGICQTCLRKL